MENSLMDAYKKEEVYISWRKVRPTTSSNIIREYYFHKQNFLLPNEITLLQKYCLYEGAYLNLYSDISMFGICPIQELTKEQAELLIKDYEQKLTQLEDSTEMRNFFSRIKEKDFILSYGKHKYSQPQHLTVQEIPLKKEVGPSEILLSHQAKNTTLNTEKVQTKMKRLKQKDEKKINNEIENKRNRSKNIEFLVNILSPFIGIVLIMVIALIAKTILK